MVKLNALNKKERDMIVRLLRKFKSPKCFEWGCGLSTQYFLRACSHISEWVSVENDAKWFEELSRKISSSKLDILYRPATVDKPKDDWWRMENESPRDLSEYFHDYIHAIDNYNPDFILIDGRSRLQCMEQSLLSLASGGVIVMDDSHRVSRNPKEWYPLLEDVKDHKFTKKLHWYEKK